MSFKHPQSAQSLNTVGIVALLVSESFTSVQSDNMDKSYQGSEMNEALVQNLAISALGIELANATQ